MTTTDVLDETTANEFAAFVEQYYSKYIQLADTKAGLALTINAGVLGFLLSRERYASSIADGWLSNYSMILLAAVIMLFVAALLCANVLRPRGDNSVDAPIYWGNVIKGSYTEYVDRVMGASGVELARWRLAHCYDLGQIAGAKYKALWTALRATFIAMSLAGVTLAWYAAVDG